MSGFVEGFLSAITPKTFGIYLASPDAIMPAKTNQSDAGFDLCSIVPADILPGDRVIVDTGVVIHLTIGWEAQIRPRSGLAAKQGLMIVNTPGTIDAGYRDTIKVILYNSGKNVISLHKGAKIAQMVIKEVPHVELIKVDQNDTNTSRGTNGFGSSGV